MAEAWNPDPLLRPVTLATAATYDDARELLGKLLAEQDPDLLADLMEHAVDKSDRAHALIYLMVSRLRGWDSPEDGVRMVSR